jgi:hypothetical protein
MEAVMCLRPGVALATVASLLAQHGVRAEPMHPGSSDPSLIGWYTLRARSDAVLDGAVRALQGHPGVDAAYARPEGEPPG